MEWETNARGEREVRKMGGGGERQDMRDEREMNEVRQREGMKRERVTMSGTE